MLSSIQFNDQFRGMTVKIYDVVSDVFLPVKDLTIELFSSQF